MPTHPKTKPAEWLDLLITKGQQLREAGVLSIELEGCSVTLSPVYAEPSKEDIEGMEDAIAQHDPLNDPDTFGGRIPTLRRMRGEG